MSALSEGILIAVCLLIWTEICSSQRFKINRNSKVSKDDFTIPSSNCGENDCSALYNATRKDEKNFCKCECEGTFSFHKEFNWSCLSDVKTRNLFGKQFNLLFFEFQKSLQVHAISSLSSNDDTRKLRN